MLDRTSLPPWLWPRAAYLHIPFCAHRCGYCDFAVTAGQDHLIDLYIEAIGDELARLGSPVRVNTIFVGGGTPTYLEARRLGQFLDVVNRWLPLAAEGEFSIEATPESVSAETIAVLADHGVNRVSLGVQSFQPRILARLDRIHGPEHVAPAFDRIRKRIDNISLDLIFGVPDQSLGDWEADLELALALAPCHISTYGLTYEKGTPLWKLRESAALRPTSEGDELAMYVRAMDRLAAAGFEHYEISNFSRPNRRCRHNETYWANEAYFGFGVGAARYVMRRRELNRRNTTDYIRCVLTGEDPTFQSEELPPDDSARETIAVQLRRSDGVHRPRFHEQTGIAFDDLAGPRVPTYVAEGLIEDFADSVRLTQRGRCVADSLAVKLAWG
jgi:oxygen-independent coproporphyrinogen III oxidase